MKKQEIARLWRLAQEWDRLYLSLLRAPISEKIPAFKQLEKRFLKEMRTAAGKRQVQRRITETFLMETCDGPWKRFSPYLRITETFLMETCDGPWKRFSPYLRRMERLGYSTMDGRLLACVMSAKASKGSLAGMRKTAELIADIERRTRGQKLHPALREEINSALARARHFAGLDSGKGLEAGDKSRKTPKARVRRSIE